MAITLSGEQQAVVDAVADGQDVIVEACVGAGKTGTIQQIVSQFSWQKRILYLTYSKLLKQDAQQRVRGAKVQNYHGIVYPHLLNAGIRTGISDSIRTFNRRFDDLSAGFPEYDMIVIDEYQDINEEYAQLLNNIKSVSPAAQVVMVGDMEQKVSATSRLDVQRFAKTFAVNPRIMPFTQSFRVGPALGQMLSLAWNKPITGVNQIQQVHRMSFDEAVEAMRGLEPGALLAMGPRKGSMVEALNRLETLEPAKFNKHTVYASIRDSDQSVQYGPGTAVFTTFDSAKGLERDVAMLFDYSEDNWDVRLGMPNTDPTVLRNVFLVAASRGKSHVVFVDPPGGRKSWQAPMIGGIRLHRFRNLPRVERAQYGDDRPFLISNCFDFKYAEDVQECFEMLDRQRLDEGQAEAIEIERADSLIDLSPVVGNYQEAVYFKDYSSRTALSAYRMGLDMLPELKAKDRDHGAWDDSLVVAAADTEQMRYVEQVDASPSQAQTDQLCARLAEQLPADAQIQLKMQMTGRVVYDQKQASTVKFQGVADVFHENRIWELKFVTELTREMFLQLALYLVISGVEEGVLWNTRTDERWLVRVPDSRRFMHAVTRAVTKQDYRAFERLS